MGPPPPAPLPLLPLLPTIDASPTLSPRKRSLSAQNNGYSTKPSTGVAPAPARLSAHSRACHGTESARRRRAESLPPPPTSGRNGVARSAFGLRVREKAYDEGTLRATSMRPPVAYDPLCDWFLRDYFGKQSTRKHLEKLGMVDSEGNIKDEIEFKYNQIALERTQRSAHQQQLRALRDVDRDVEVELRKMEKEFVKKRTLPILQHKNQLLEETYIVGAHEGEKDECTIQKKAGGDKMKRKKGKKKPNSSTTASASLKSANIGGDSLDQESLDFGTDDDRYSGWSDSEEDSNHTDYGSDDFDVGSGIVQTDSIREEKCVENHTHIESKFFTSLEVLENQCKLVRTNFETSSKKNMLKEGDTLSLLAESSNSIMNKKSEYFNIHECVSSTFLDISKKCLEFGQPWSDIRRFLAEAINYAPNDKEHIEKLLRYRELLCRRVNNPLTKHSIEQLFEGIDISQGKEQEKVESIGVPVTETNMRTESLGQMFQRVNESNYDEDTDFSERDYAPLIEQGFGNQMTANVVGKTTENSIDVPQKQQPENSANECEQTKDELGISRALPTTIENPSNTRTIPSSAEIGTYEKVRRIESQNDAQENLNSDPSLLTISEDKGLKSTTVRFKEENLNIRPAPQAENELNGNNGATMPEHGKVAGEMRENAIDSENIDQVSSKNELEKQSEPSMKTLENFITNDQSSSKDPTNDGKNIVSQSHQDKNSDSSLSFQESSTSNLPAESIIEGDILVKEDGKAHEETKKSVTYTENIDSSIPATQQKEHGSNQMYPNEEAVPLSWQTKSKFNEFSNEKIAGTTITSFQPNIVNHENMSTQETREPATVVGVGNEGQSSNAKMECQIEQNSNGGALNNISNYDMPLEPVANLANTHVDQPSISIPADNSSSGNMDAILINSETKSPKNASKVQIQDQDDKLASQNQILESTIAAQYIVEKNVIATIFHDADYISVPIQESKDLLSEIESKPSSKTVAKEEKTQSEVAENFDSAKNIEKNDNLMPEQNVTVTEKSLNQHSDILLPEDAVSISHEKEKLLGKIQNDIETCPKATVADKTIVGQQEPHDCSSKEEKKASNTQSPKSTSKRKFSSTQSIDKVKKTEILKSCETITKRKNSVGNSPKKTTGQNQDKTQKPAEVNSSKTTLTKKKSGHSAAEISPPVISSSQNATSKVIKRKNQSDDVLNAEKSQITDQMNYTAINRSQKVAHSSRDIIKSVKKQLDSPQKRESHTNISKSLESKLAVSAAAVPVKEIAKPQSKDRISHYQTPIIHSAFKIALPDSLHSILRLNKESNAAEIQKNENPERTSDHNIAAHRSQSMQNPDSIIGEGTTFSSHRGLNSSNTNTAQTIMLPSSVSDLELRAVSVAPSSNVTPPSTISETLQVKEHRAKSIPGVDDESKDCKTIDVALKSKIPHSTHDLLKEEMRTSSNALHSIKDVAAHLPLETKSATLNFSNSTGIAALTKATSDSQQMKNKIQAEEPNKEEENSQITTVLGILSDYSF